MRGVDETAIGIDGASMSLGSATLRGMSFRKLLTGATLGLSVLLAGCVNSPNYSSVRSPFQPNLNPDAMQGQVAGRTIGNGSVRVGLLLPYSGEGQTAVSVATLFENSAKLALEDFQGADIQLLVKDTGGTGEGASLAAQQAINEGAELLIGRSSLRQSREHLLLPGALAFQSSPSPLIPMWPNPAPTFSAICRFLT